MIILSKVLNPKVEGSLKRSIFEENERENIIAELHYECRKQYLKYEQYLK